MALTLTILLITAIPVSANRYFPVKGKMTCDQAVSNCIALGGLPAAIRSEQDNTDIANVATSQFWLGARDDGKQGEVYWLSDNSSLTYTKWCNDTDPNPIPSQSSNVSCIRFRNNCWDKHDSSTQLDGGLCEYQNTNIPSSDIPHYFLINGQMGWDLAFSNCAVNGAVLASIKSAENQTAAVAAAVGLHGTGYWLGGHSDENKTFTWISDNSIVNFTYGDSVPDWNSGSIECLRMAADSRWDDDSCGYQCNGAICEQSVASMSPRSETSTGATEKNETPKTTSPTETTTISIKNGGLLTTNYPTSVATATTSVFVSTKSAQITTVKTTMSTESTNNAGTDANAYVVSEITSKLEYADNVTLPSKKIVACSGDWNPDLSNSSSALFNELADYMKDPIKELYVGYDSVDIKITGFERGSIISDYIVTLRTLTELSDAQIQQKVDEVLRSLRQQGTSPKTKFPWGPAVKVTTTNFKANKAHSAANCLQASTIFAYSAMAVLLLKTI